ncbi:hypothetical protein D3C73_1122350 [compost metagenome]
MTLVITKGEGFRHRQRLGNAGGLDQQVIKAAIPGQLANLFEQVFAKRATDAAVTHLDQFFFGTIQADITLNLTAVDVDFTHVVDDHRHPKVVAVTQNVVQQGAFSGTEKAGEYGNGETVGHQVFLIRSGQSNELIML